jgi:sec-independent protein translocase protein TatA
MPFAWWELVLILLVLLLVFGAKRLPEMGRSLGKGMREFKDSVSGMDEHEPAPPAQLPPASPEPEQARTDTEPAPAEKSKRETVS